MVQILLNHYNIDESWCYEVLKDKISPLSKVAILAFSFHDLYIKNLEDWQKAYDKSIGRYYNDMVKPLLQYGIKEEDIVLVNYFKDTKKSAKEKLAQSDIIYLTGGLPDRMMQRIVEFDLAKTIENFKGIIIGCSAGAMIQMDTYHITPDADYKRFSYQNGLNLIKDFDIEVHYEGSVIQEDCIKRSINEKKKRIYALEDNGGLVYEDGVVTPFGRVHYYKALKTKTLKRVDWYRVLEKDFTNITVNSDVFQGEVGLLQIKKIKKPLDVYAGKDRIRVADVGYYWLQFAPVNKNYWLTVMMNDKGRIVQYYFDISHKNIIRQDGTSFFYDLYLDVVVVPSGKIYLLDEDELEEAYDKNIIDKDDYILANKTAKYLMSKLGGKEKELRAFCMYYYKKLLGKK